MGVLYTALALILGYGTAYVASEDVRYLTRAGIEQTLILEKRKPLTRLVADSSLPAETRAYLSLVLAVRAHAESLGLEAGKTYTAYSDVGRDTLLLVLQAALKDCICPYTWKYPIVGRIPYKGFFDFKKAPNIKAALRAEVDPDEFTLKLDSEPFPVRGYHRIAVKVVDVYGNESTVVRDLA